MKNSILLITILTLFSVSLFSQKYYSKTGEISFFSKTPIEDIEAVSRTASTVVDMASGKIQFAVLIKSFEFEKALMQEHFNENYMESSKFPKAKFKGSIGNFDTIDLNIDGEYAADVAGILELHGVEQDITTKATFKVTNNKITATSQINIALTDFNIEIPSVVKENIAKEIAVRLNINYEPLEKP